MLVFGLKNCDTCRKALKSLPDAQLLDVRSDGIPAEVLSQALAEFGDGLVNTRSTTWRNLDDSERARPQLALLEAHPSLMKRPLIVDGETMYLGWTPNTRAALGVA